MIFFHLHIYITRQPWLAQRLLAMLDPASNRITLDAFIIAKVPLVVVYAHSQSNTPTQAAALKQGEEAATAFVFSLLGSAQSAVNAAQLQQAIAAAATLAVPDAHGPHLTQFCDAIAHGYFYAHSV